MGGSSSSGISDKVLFQPYLEISGTESVAFMHNKACTFHLNYGPDPAINALQSWQSGKLEAQTTRIWARVGFTRVRDRGLPGKCA